jgi:Xaa-Pro aminopeptidase
LKKLRRHLEERELDAILISQAENRRYLSGFTGSSGFLLISSAKAILATDFRYVEQAALQAPQFEIFHTRGGLTEWLPELASSLGIKKLGFEAADMSFAVHQQLAEAVARVSLRLIPSEGLVEGLRAVKEEEEKMLLSQAAELADAAWEHILSLIHPGMTERQAAWEIEKFLREQGSEVLPFEVMVASGPNSALPHARPMERPLNPGEPVIIDLGARVGGYCSDLTRTICLGDSQDQFARIYDLVLGAQLTALATLKEGMSGEEADRLARTVIEQGNHGKAFGHGLGHGIGLAAHEEPRLGPGSATIIQPGMVFTVEPGIYIPGWGGVRIEDMVVMEREGARVLTKAKK